MQDQSKKSIANSLEVEENLLKYMPYLLQDLWALGSSVARILELIETLPLASSNPKVLDLGCGKGAVSVQIASRFGYEVVGVDAMPEFLEVARTKSSEYLVSHICTFIQQDILTYVTEPHTFDIVILASLGGIFGTNKDNVKTLRTQVKPGGYIIIDDGFLKNKEVLNRKGYDYCRDYKTTIDELKAFGDSLVSEISTNEVSKNINEEYIKLIDKRIMELIAENPDLEKDLKKYLALQREECEILDTEVEGRIWVLKKAEV